MANKTRLCFQVNNFCNLNCSYCYEKNKGNTEMKIEDAKYFIDRFVEEDKSYFGDYFMDKPKEIILDFIGGESTLSMKVVEGITEYFYKKCIEKGLYDWVINSDIWLETNGTTYFRQDVKSYIEKHKEKLDLPITLDGCKELHDKCRKYYNGKGSYDDVEKAVKDYIALTGRTPNSKLTLSPENVKYFYEGIKNFIQLGWGGPQTSPSSISFDGMYVKAAFFGREYLYSRRKMNTCPSGNSYAQCANFRVSPSR